MTDISTDDTTRTDAVAATSKRATAAKAKTEVASTSKTDLVLKKLRGAKGMTLAQLSELTGWQAHSVRGFLSGTVRKKLGLNLTSDAGKDGVRRYRISDRADGASS